MLAPRPLSGGVRRKWMLGSPNKCRGLKGSSMMSVLTWVGLTAIALIAAYVLVDRYLIWARDRHFPGYRVAVRFGYQLREWNRRPPPLSVAILEHSSGPMLQIFENGAWSWIPSVEAIAEPGDLRKVEAQGDTSDELFRYLERHHGTSSR